MRLLLDTNVISELRKVRLGRADPGVAAWAETIDAADLHISAITVQELEIGVLRLERKDARQGAVLRAWLTDHVLPAFEGRILPVDTAVALRAASLHVPDPRPLHDGLIAATSLVHGLGLVTRNVSDFTTMGMTVVNPWTEGNPD